MAEIADLIREKTARMERDRRDYLLSGYVGETLTDAEGRELADHIARDATTRARLLDQLILHRLLHESARLPADSGRVLQALSEPPDTADAVMSRLRAKSAIGREETITDSFHRRPAAKASHKLPTVERSRWAWIAWGIVAVAVILAVVYIARRML